MEFSFIILTNHENLGIDTSLDILLVILTEIHISCQIKSNNKDHSERTFLSCPYVNVYNYCSNYIIKLYYCYIVIISLLYYCNY